LHPFLVSFYFIFHRIDIKTNFILDRFIRSRNLEIKCIEFADSGKVVFYAVVGNLL